MGIFESFDIIKNQGKQYLKDAFGGLLNPEWTPERAKTAGSLLLDMTPIVGDIKSGYEGIQAAKQGDYLGAGLGALGALPLVPNMAGMFIGKGAKTWDAVKASQAMDMEKAGVDPRKIWSETGNWKGPDGHWRQEIPDDKASIISNKLPTEEVNGYGYHEKWKLQDALGHDPLYSAYPEFRSINNSFSTGRDAQGSFSGLDGGWISYNSQGFKRPYLSPERKKELESLNKQASELSNRPDVIAYDKRLGELLNAPSDVFEAEFNRLGGSAIEDARSNIAKKQLALTSSIGDFSQGSMLTPEARSITLHELQHAIQGKEGWARGGSPDEFNPQAAEKARDILSWRNQVEQWITKNWPNAKHDTETLRNADQRLRDEYHALGAYEWVPPVELRDEALKYTFKQGSPLRSQLEQTVKEFGLDKKATPTSSMDMYKRLAGEAEARATQARMNMDMAERLRTFPADSYDVPLDQLIIRGLLNP